MFEMLRAVSLEWLTDIKDILLRKEIWDLVEDCSIKGLNLKQKKRDGSVILQKGQEQLLKQQGNRLIVDYFKLSLQLLFF